MRRVAFALLLTASCVAGSLVLAGSSSRPPTSPAPLTFSDSGPEPQLVKILDEIENNRLDKALSRRKPC